MPQPDRFDRLLANYATLLPLMRPERETPNCPLTAEAVWKYFTHGEVVRASSLMHGMFVAECGDSVATRISAIRATLKRRGHGAHALVTANPNAEHEHSFNVVNIRGTIYLVDAYTNPAVVTPKLEDFLGYAKQLDITFNVQMRVVPADATGTVTCP
jgi:hypothetical protein